MNMRRAMTSLSLTMAVLVAGSLTAGCGSAVKSAVGNLSSRGATIAASATTDTPATTVTPTTTITPTVTNTVTPTVTTTVTSTATATTPAPTSASATPGPGSGTSPWLWVLLAAAGLAVLIGLIAWISQSAGRRKAAAADWRSGLIDAYAKGSALHDAMVVAEGGMAAGDANARWYDIQRRADDLAQTLYALREAAPDPDYEARIADTLAALQAVRSAMDAERAPGGTSPQQAEVVRSRLHAFEGSLHALRADTDGY